MIISCTFSSFGSLRKALYFTKILYSLPVFLLLLAVASCGPASRMHNAFSYIPVTRDTLPDSDLLVHLIQKNKGKLGPVVSEKDSFRLQIIYTQINRNDSNQPSFSHHFYNVKGQYFYPASTVKLPAAVLALEKLNNLQLPGVNASTTMLTDSSYSGQSAVYNDPTSFKGQPSVAHYIKKIFLVSDNDAYNRLYEFIGQQALNERLHTFGFENAQLLHRLSIFLTEDQNRHTNAIRFVDSSGNTLFNQFAGVSKLKYIPRTDFLGKGYMTSGSNVNSPDSLVNAPLDFSKKNKWPLPYHHAMLQWVMFPQTQPLNNKLNLKEGDYRFLHKYMSMLPGESSSPHYDSSQYPDAYAKFLLMGSRKGAWPDFNIRIFNKIGDAYGFLTDAAYIIDKKNGVEFMLSCTLYCNSDGIFNDDTYDFETVGFPFMKALGEVIYDYEKKRKRTNKPDFSNFVFQYADQK